MYLIDVIGHWFFELKVGMGEKKKTDGFVGLH
jgi:hypothetical protein